MYRAAVTAAAALILLIPALAPAGETAEQAAARHARVAQRRAGVAVICHRGAWEFAHENTLDAFRATFEIGADGNEVDVRATRDGVLVCFHDDMLDMILAGAYGDVADHTWAELQAFRFRDPGPMAATCRVPTLEDVLALHRDHGGLVMLDVKRPGLDDAITRVLQRTDMWDHVIAANAQNAPTLAKDERIKPRRFKAGLFQDRGDVFPDQIAAALKLPGDDLIVDDPRAAIVALGRTLGKPSPKSTAPTPQPSDARPGSELVEILRDRAGWDRVASGDAEEKASARRIVERARAADALLERGGNEPGAFEALVDAARHRSLHKQWIYHGLDGATALRASLVLKFPESVKLARKLIWEIDPALRAVRDPHWPNPLAWADWRIKQVAMTSVGQYRGAESAKVCLDYLALTDEQANEIGVPLFEAATRSLLQIKPDEATAVALMKHRRQDVRGRAILECLAHAEDRWAMNALRAAAPHALAYVVQR